MKAWLQTFGKDNGAGTYAISTSTESLVVSILSAGTFFGALLAVSQQYLYSFILSDEFS